VGAERIAWELRSYVLSGLVLGATPVSTALPTVQAALGQAREGSLEEAAAQRAMAQLLAFGGSVDDGRTFVDLGVQTFRDAGLLVTACGWSLSQSEIERRAGDTEAQIRVLREAYEILEQLGDRFFFPTVSIWLANALLDARADVAEIESLCRVARERTIEGDLANFIGLGWADARLLAASGDLDAAETAARQALVQSDETDHFLMRARSRVVLAEVLHHAGREVDARPLAAEGLSIYEAKEDVSGAARWRSYLAERGIEVA
jgi:hypothetical protein